MRTFMAATILGMLLATACDEGGIPPATQACIDEIQCFADCIAMYPAGPDIPFTDEPRPMCTIACGEANEYRSIRSPPHATNDQDSLDAYTASLARCFE